MDDLISRQAALAWCKKDDWGTPDERWRPESEYGRYIETLPTAEQQWIPISKKQPENSGLYLTTTMYGEVYADYWNSINFDRTELVIAWMPLPKPYMWGQE